MKIVKKTNESRIRSFISWGSVAFLSIYEFKEFFPFIFPSLKLEGHETALILPAIVMIFLNQLAQQEVAQEAIIEIQNIESKTLEILKKEKAGLIADIGTVKVFEDFVGNDYFAYNAPLQYEIEDLSSRIEFHIGRYKNPRFERAYYYYPIFASEDEATKKDWILGVKKFFTQLSERLSEEEKKKITFYVPDDQYKLKPSSNITYFFGESSQGAKAVVYIHNFAFMDMEGKIPKRMLVIYDEKTIDDLRLHRTITTKNMEHIEGIDNFLNKYQDIK